MISTESKMLIVFRKYIRQKNSQNNGKDEGNYFVFFETKSFDFKVFKSDTGIQHYYQLKKRIVCQRGPLKFKRFKHP